MKDFAPKIHCVVDPYLLADETFIQYKSDSGLLALKVTVTHVVYRCMFAFYILHLLKDFTGE